MRCVNTTLALVVAMALSRSAKALTIGPLHIPGGEIVNATEAAINAKNLRASAKRLEETRPLLMNVHNHRTATLTDVGVHVSSGSCGFMPPVPAGGDSSMKCQGGMFVGPSGSFTLSDRITTCRFTFNHPYGGGTSRYSCSCNNARCGCRQASGGTYGKTNELARDGDDDTGSCTGSGHAQSIVFTVYN